MVSYNKETIGIINLFEQITGAHVKDCFFSESSLVFIVQPGEIGKAIGKKGVNIRRLGNRFKKQIKIIEFDHEPEKFAANLLFPIKPEEIKREDAIVRIKAHNPVEKGKIFGREKTNLKRLQEIISKYFPVELRVE